MNINRVPAGVPTGGEFAAGARGEPNAQWPAEPASRTEYGILSYTRTSEQLHENLAAVRQQDEHVSALRDAFSFSPNPAPAREREVLDEIADAEDELTRRHRRLRNVIEAHATLSDQGLDDVLDLHHRGALTFDNAETAGGFGRISAESMAWQRESVHRRAHDVAAMGMGNRLEPVDPQDAAATLGVGSRWARAWIGPGTGTMPVEDIEVGDSEADRLIGRYATRRGEPVYDRAAYQDEKGNLLFTDLDGRPINAFIRS